MPGMGGEVRERGWVVLVSRAAGGMPDPCARPGPRGDVGWFRPGPGVVDAADAIDGAG